MVENIVIPTQFYVNYSSRQGARLGFATYFEDNAAFRKRKVTIDNWADKSDEPDTFDNTPRSGFTLSKRVTHGGGWNDLSVYWRIVDPSGFELEISSGNVAKLFQYCLIDKGAIAGECVWGWDKGNGSKVVLIPINSEIYVAAKETSDLHHAKPMSLKDLSLGDEAVLKNGTKGKYLGKINYLYHVFDQSEHGGGKSEVQIDSTYAFSLNDNTALYFMNTPKVASVEKTPVPLTQAESLALINGVLSRTFNGVYDGTKCSLQAAGDSTKISKMMFATFDKIADIHPTMVTTEVGPDEIMKRVLATLNGHKNYYYMPCELSNFIEYNGHFLLRLKSGMRVLLAHTDFNERNPSQRDRVDRVAMLGEVANGDLSPLEMSGFMIVEKGFDETKPSMPLARDLNYVRGSRYYYSNSQNNYLLKIKFSFDEIVSVAECKVEYKGMERSLARH